MQIIAMTREPESPFRVSFGPQRECIIRDGRAKIILSRDEVGRLLGSAFNALAIVEALPDMTPRKMAATWRRQRVACGLESGGCE